MRITQDMMTTLHPMLRLSIVRLLLAALMTACLALPAHAAAKGDSPAQDIIAAGQLRLQSQRLAKLYLQAGLGIQSDSARIQIGRADTQFDEALNSLGRYSRQANTARPLERIQALWGEYRTALAAPYSPAALQRVNGLSDALMLAAGKLTLLIEEESSTGVGRLLDLSLRQNMLAQRLARLYLLAQAGDHTQGRLVDIEQARREFTTALAELANAKENTNSVREALDLARMQWIFFDQALTTKAQGNSSDAASHARNVATTSERILEVLDSVSRQYARSYGNLS